MSSISAVALFSGGLDSTLAILTILRQGIKVKAVTFLNHFGCEISDTSSCSRDPFSASEKFGFEVKLCHLSEQFIEIVKHPKFGHGKNMNPCRDCRVLMLREAKAFMEMTNADLIITGEVLGQRPMSQRRDAMDIIDKEAGLKRQVLRPLSAKLMRVTMPEERGLVDRDLLHDFSGRSRKPQMALARELGLTDYPAPAGGCLLTEPNFSFRLKELLAYNENPSLLDFQLLKIGRHFRLENGQKIILGRNREENERLMIITKGKGTFIRATNCGSPLCFVAEADDRTVMTAAAICARYSDARQCPEVEVQVINDSGVFYFTTPPAAPEVIESRKIEKRRMLASELRVSPGQN